MENDMSNEHSDPLTEQEVDKALITSFDEHQQAVLYAPYSLDEHRVQNPVRRPLVQIEPSPKRHKGAAVRTWTGWQGLVPPLPAAPQNAPTEPISLRESTANPDTASKTPTEGCHVLSNGTRVEQPTRLRYWITQPLGSYWTHEPYRGTKGELVQVHYATSLDDSERVARLFVDEKVLGFDMEWKPRGSKGIKQNISLIQVACEDKIALFHIALHDGQRVDQLLAPTLRKIIESPEYTKTGVAILNADGNRLRRFMKLQPRGMFELSYLHRVVHFGQHKPELVTKKLIKLATLVHIYLGKPLFKGKVRTSDWTKPLDQDQIRYSAADAYAGFRLYHAMEAKRLKMTPVLPRPDFAELGLPLRLSTAPEATEPSEPAPQPSSRTKPSKPTAVFKQPSCPGVRAILATTDLNSFPLVPADAIDRDPLAKRALSALRGLRIQLARKASLHAPDALASDVVLAHVAVSRPRTAFQIQCLPGCYAFSELAAQHGVDLLAFLAKHAPEPQDANAGGGGAIVIEDDESESESANGFDEPRRPRTDASCSVQEQATPLQSQRKGARRRF